MLDRCSVSSLSAEVLHCRELGVLHFAGVPVAALGMGIRSDTIRNGCEWNSFQQYADEIDGMRPSRIVQRVDPYALRVLPIAVTLVAIPGLDLVDLVHPFLSTICCQSGKDAEPTLLQLVSRSHSGAAA